MLQTALMTVEAGRSNKIAPFCFALHAQLVLSYVIRLQRAERGRC